MFRKWIVALLFLKRGVFMCRLSIVCGMGILSLALLVGAGNSQDGKKDKDDKKEGVKYKPQLPTGFKALNLSKEQIGKIYAVQTDYHIKIAELESKISELKERKKQEAFKILTKVQHEKYLKSVGVDTKDKSAPKEKAADKK
jgi:hypothetical protein